MVPTFDYGHEIEKNVSRETFLKLQEFKKLLLKWNKTHNLTSRTTISNSHLDELIIDSMSLDNLVPKGEKILDIGSGGGFPGLILAILGHNIDLVERNYKKSVFLNEAKRHLHLDTCKVFNSDVKDLKINEPYNFICSKAMASTTLVINLSHNYISPRGIYLLLKSSTQLAEIDEARKQYHFNLQVIENNYNNDNVVLILSNVQDAKNM
jgi:16S rRNA (guanine527-N7)-methyltransferase